jgi:hypothetical protein
MALIDTNNITTEENLIDFLLDQYEETKNHMFLTAANSLALYRRDINFLNFCSDRSNKWISVEDRLPEDNIKYLVFLPEGHLYQGIHVAHYSDKHNMWVDLDRTYLFDHPTHWMPLPAPPTEKEN